MAGGAKLSLNDQLAPRYFISYSRKQVDIAKSLGQVLPEHSQTVWFDQDDIGHGDDWMAQIEQGITECDELVLIVSEDSLKSEIVKEEVAIAERQGKLIRPCVLDNLKIDELGAIKKYHFVLLSAAGDNNAVLTFLFNPPYKNDLQYLKTKAVRGIYPEFTYPLTAAQKEELREIEQRLARLHGQYHKASTLWLNYGLVLCMDEQWGRGIEILRRHAEAANNAAGWYFYGLHASGQKRLSVIAASQAESVYGAAVRAAAGGHPLAALLRLFAQTGAKNYGMMRAERDFTAIISDDIAVSETPAEYRRFVWCMRAALADMGPLKNNITHYLKGKMG